MLLGACGLKKYVFGEITVKRDFYVKSRGNHVFPENGEIAENTRNPPPAGEAQNISIPCNSSMVLGPVGRRRREFEEFH